MYGHGAAPPTRSAATVITLRVLLAASGILTCGIFACVPLFRIALLRGRWYEWAAAWLSLPLAISCFMVVGLLPETDHRTDFALAVVLLLGAVSSAWFVTVDIRHHNEQRRHAVAGYGAPQGPTLHAGHGGYAYPQAVSPYAQTHVPQPHAPHTPHPQAGPVPPAHPTPAHPTPAHPTPVHQTPVHQTPVPPAGGPAPGPARIDQVRAELDELSDYLRRQDGTSQGGTPQDGGR